MPFTCRTQADRVVGCADVEVVEEDPHSILIVAGVSGEGPAYMVVLARWFEALHTRAETEDGLPDAVRTAPGTCFPTIGTVTDSRVRYTRYRTAKMGKGGAYLHSWMPGPAKFKPADTEASRRRPAARVYTGRSMCLGDSGTRTCE